MYEDLINESFKLVQVKKEEKNKACKSCGKDKEDISKVYCNECRIVHQNIGYNTTKGIMVILENGDKRLKHDLIIEEKIGRPLETREVVVHLDSDKMNNDLNNLELRVRFGYGLDNNTLKCSSCQSRDIVYEL